MRRSNLSKYAFIIALLALSRTMVEPEQTLVSLVTLVYMVPELVVYPAFNWRRNRQEEKEAIPKPEISRTLAMHFIEKGWTDNN